MEKWEKKTQVYHAIREKLRHKLHHPGQVLDWKVKDFIGSDQTLLFISQSRISMCNLHWYCSFWTV